MLPYRKDPGPIDQYAIYWLYFYTHQAISKCHLGSSLATIAVCLPSFILVLAISAAFAKFRHNRYVDAAFYGLRPATVGLIAAAALLLMNKENFIDLKSLVIFIVSFLLVWKFRVHPILMIFLAGVMGFVLYS